MRFVIPGEVIAETPKRDIENSYVENGKTYSAVVGFYYEEKGKVQQLEGPFIPKKGDMVVGVVIEARHNNYLVDINSPYKGILFERGRGPSLITGQVILARVSFVDEVKNVELEDAKVLKGGEIVEIKSAKVPRVLGKSASMLLMLKEMTGCEIVVGANGRVWIVGENSPVATYAILKIEREAHIPGLTDRIKQFLEKELKR